jgi:hypothetical protein
MEMQDDWKYIPMPDIVQKIFNKDNLPTYHELYDYFLNNRWNEYGNVGYDTDEYKNSVMEKVITWINARLYNMVLPIKEENDKMVAFLQSIVDRATDRDDDLNLPYNVAEALSKSYIPTYEDGSFDPYMGVIHILKPLPYYNTGYIGFHIDFDLYCENHDNSIHSTSIPLTDEDKEKLIDIWFDYVKKYYAHVQEKKASDAAVDNLHNREMLNKLSEEYRMHLWDNSLKIPLIERFNGRKDICISYFTGGKEFDDARINDAYNAFIENEHSLTFNVASRLGWSLMKRMRRNNTEITRIYAIVVTYTDHLGVKKTTHLELLSGSVVSVYTGEMVKENHNVMVPGTKNIPVESISLNGTDADGKTLTVRIVDGTHEYDGTVVGCQSGEWANVDYIELLPRTGININNIAFTWPVFQYVE